MAIAATGMKNDELRLATISQNIANVLTPGYKKQIAVSGTFAAQLDTAAAMPSASRLSIDPAAGPLRATGNATDVAIEGPGFLALNGPDGLVYTRQGSLRVDVHGRLVAGQGWPVMGQAGEIALTNDPFTILPKGDIRQGERLAGRLQLVRFDAPEQLEPAGQSTYRQGRAQVDTTGAAGVIRTGFQEGSNVNSPQEMVRLTETVRHYEALHRVVQGYDETLEKAIRKLGEF